MPGTQERYERLLEAGLALSSELSLPAILQRIVELAAGITGARYGALGVLGRDGRIIEFITTGVTPQERAAIGHIPVGRGILGVLIDDAVPLRLRDIEQDARSVGFPPNHPPMRSFLGAPVTARGQVFGNIYLTEKQGAAEFDAEDERALVLLAAQAGVAIENAHLYEEADELRGAVFPVEGSVTGEVIRTGKAMVLADASTDARTSQPVVGGGIGPAAFVPLAVRGRTFGTLMVGNASGGPPLRETAVQLLETFAEQAAVALEYARLQRELHRLAVLEDRERIAKELHDGAIQALFAVGMGLQGSAMLAGDEELRRRIENAVEELDRVVRDLRNYIFGLRPGILADRQLDQALQRLVEELQQRSGVVAVAEIDPAAAAELAGRAGDLIQLAREALSNVSRHAGAATCRVSLYPTEEGAVLEVDDDGRGFDPGRTSGGGQGLRNLRERAAALGGRAEIASVAGEGTRIRVTIPR